ncbi:hypothetical protein [Lentilactobacillus sp. Marseille-Q4993]|uniref:hypothetical protein n=1 Tax=Lentilactobacillus sp. Marseille-Q4993 TaxID=3039492 RepID=UPI0024BD4B5F|nr:hypothetical protein [Lentilactobacillus sp. Marseille-Q4993]
MNEKSDLVEQANNDVSKFWVQLRNDDRIRGIRGVSEFQKKMVITNFVASVRLFGTIDMGSWTFSDVFHGIETLLGSEGNRGTDNHEVAKGYLVIKNFLQWGYDEQVLPSITEGDFKSAMTFLDSYMYSKSADISADSGTISAIGNYEGVGIDTSFYILDGAVGTSIKPWNRSEYNEVCQQCLSLCKRFFVSERRKGIMASLKAEQVKFYVMNFAQAMYNYHRETPANWSTKAEKDVLTGWFVKNMVIPFTEYANIRPVLVRFFDFAAGKKAIPTGVAYLMGQMAIETSATMERLAGDPANYSAEKILGMKLVDPNFDPNEKQVVDTAKIVSFDLWKKRNHI